MTTTATPLPEWVYEEMKKQDILPPPLKNDERIQFTNQEWESFHDIEKQACIQLSFMSGVPLSIEDDVSKLKHIAIAPKNLSKRTLSSAQEEVEKEIELKRMKQSILEDVRRIFLL